MGLLISTSSHYLCNWMSNEVLLSQYEHSSRLFQLADKLSFARPQKIFLKNLQGSSSQFIISAVFAHPACAELNHLIILNDAEEAAYFHNTLENLTSAMDLFYFPFSFKIRWRFLVYLLFVYAKFGSCFDAI